MPRRPREEAGVSLFPFMSVLASLIGILTLLIAANMIANAKKQEGITQEEHDKALKYKSLKVKELELLAKIEKDEAQLKIDKKTAFELLELRELSDELLAKLEELKKLNKDVSEADLKELILNLNKEAKALDDDQPALKERIAELKAQLKKHKDHKVKESVVIKPPGFGTKVPKNLFFVECNETGVVVRNPPKGESFKVAQAAIATNEKYAQFCEQVSDTKDSMVLFLVRKTGNETYLWGAGIADSKYELRTGKLPAPNNGEIDLSLFNKR